jgi:acyl CoA:acetate/3-ketoacid CoA transferase
MKRVIVALIVGISIGVTGVAGAAQQGWSHRQNGIWCKEVGTMVGCVPMAGRGYGVAISRDAVLVMDIRTNKNVFSRYQP